MICKECGTVLPDVAKFCFNCGVTVEAEPVKEEQENVNVEDTEVTVTEEVEEQAAEEVEETEETVEEAEAGEEEQAAEEVEETEETVEEAEAGEEEQVAEEVEETEETVEEAEAGEEEQAAEEVEETEETTEETEASEEFLDEDFKEDEEDSDKEESGEELEEESTESEEEEDPDAGFKYCIMKNPDYVPPEVEEEKPFFEEHIDYQGMYREKAEKVEKLATKVAAAVAIVAAVVGIGYFGIGFINSQQYKKSMEEADKLYVEKSYDAAIEKYNSALTMKKADKNEIALGLSKAYQGKGDTQGAIKVVLDIYNETGNQDLYSEYQRLKALSENVESDDKTDKEPSGDKENNDNATNEYDQIIIQINEKLDKDDTQAVIDLCRQAIAIDATREEAYLAEAQIYSKQLDYTNAASVIQKGIDERNKSGKPASVDLANKLKEYQDASEKLTEYEETFSSLASALAGTMTNASNLDGVINALLSDTYKKAYSAAEVTYYTEEEGFVNSISSGSGMAIYSTGYVYYGDWDEGKRLGSGILVSAEKKNDVVSYYMYKGDWAGDLPNGTGTITYVTGYGSDTNSRSITMGSFADGCEDGDMIISKTVNGTSWGKMEYTVNKGKPNPIVEDGKTKTNRDGKPIMGYYYLIEKATHIAIINESTKLVVNGLGLN